MIWEIWLSEGQSTNKSKVQTKTQFQNKTYVKTILCSSSNSNMKDISIMSKLEAMGHGMNLSASTISKNSFSASTKPKNGSLAQPGEIKATRN